MEKRTVCSTPPGCHNGCGIIVTVEDGRVIRVKGDPSNPFNNGSVCPRGAALPETVYNSERILHPLRKTSAGWKQISWESALNEIGERFNLAAETHGPESVIFCKGTGRDIGPWLSRLAYGFGSPEYYALGPGSGSACLMPRMSVTNALFGGFITADCSQYSPLRYDDPEWELPRCILVWGSNPVDSNPDGFLGQWIVRCMQMGSKLITVDPRRTWMARRSRIHLAVNPGTDGALAMAFLNVIFQAGLVDTEFTGRWISGMEEVKQQVSAYTPEYAEKLCGVPAELIRKGALLYGNSKPSALHWGVSVDMSPSALGTAHALSSLVALSGNLDVPGGNVLVSDPYGISRRGADRNVSSRLQNLKTGLSEYPMTGSGYPYAHAGTLLDQIEKGREIKCAWYQGTGITANGFANPSRAGRLLRRTGFTVAVDMYMTKAFTDLADVFLPVCSCLERRGIRNWWYQLAAFDRVIEPLGESRSDMEIVLQAGKMIAPDHFPWDNVTGWFDEVLKPSGHSWAQLVEKGWLMPGARYRKHLTEGGFRTPSGRIELQPEIMKRAGILPAPWYIKPPSEKKFSGFPLKLTTGARTPYYFHGEHKNVPSLRRYEPRPLVEVHPDDLPEGMEPGDWVKIESPWGSCCRVVSRHPAVRSGVVSAAHGWKGKSLNVNQLLDSHMEGKGGLGYPFRCLPCRLSGPVPPPEEFSPVSFPSSKAGPLLSVETIWCTGCRACQISCRMHTGLNGIEVTVENGEFIPVFTSACVNCLDPVCVAACHTGCLKGVFCV